MLNAFVRQHFETLLSGAIITYAIFIPVLALFRAYLRSQGKQVPEVKFWPMNFEDKARNVQYLLRFWHFGTRNVVFAAGVTIWRLSVYVFLYVAVFSMVSAGQGHPMN